MVGTRTSTSVQLSRVVRSPWHGFALGHCTMLVEYGCECQLWEGGMKCEPPKQVAPAGHASQLSLRGLRGKVAAGHVEHIAAFCWTWPVVQFCTWTIFHAAGTCKSRCVRTVSCCTVVCRTVSVYSLVKVWLSGLGLVMQLHVFHKAWNMHLGTVNLVITSCQAGCVNMRYIA